MTARRAASIADHRVNPAPALPLYPRVCLAALLAVGTFLVVADLVFARRWGPSESLAALFDLDGEANIPTWFSNVELVAVAILCLACAYIEGRSKRVPLSDRIVWAGIVGLFLVLSVEEFVGLHERVSGAPQLEPVLDHVFGGASPVVRDVLGHGYRYSWIVFYAPVIVLAVALLLRFAIRHFRGQARLRRIMLSATGLYVLVILAEIAAKSQGDPSVLAALVVAEEYLEMTGTAVFAFGFLVYLELLLDALLRGSDIPAQGGRDQPG